MEDDGNRLLRSVSASAPIFAGAPPPTPWDPALQAVMSQRRRALFEEEIGTELLRSMLETV